MTRGNQGYQAVNARSATPEPSATASEGPSAMRVCASRSGRPPFVPPSARARVDGWGINLADEASALDQIIGAGKAGHGFTVFTLNLDHLVKLRTSAAFRKAYSHASFVTADGAPVARLARRQDAGIVRTTGADLVQPLVQRAADAALPVFLFGTSPAVLAEAGRRLAQMSQGRLDVVGTLAPEHGFDPEGPAADEAIARIRASGARLCFVALGAPKQEIFSARAVAQGVEAGFVCIGAALDFVSGDQVRAPQFFQSAGLEWLWRLGTNPRRLAARYAQCALLLARITVIEPLFGPAAPRRMS